MAKVGIFETPPKKWFDFDPDTEVLIQHVDKEAMARLLKQAGEAAQKVKAKAGVVSDMFLGKAAVHGWRNKKDHDHPGLLLPGGDPLHFSPENRNTLMTRCREFSEFVFTTSTNAAGFLDDGANGLLDDPAAIETLLGDVPEEDLKN